MPTLCQCQRQVLVALRSAFSTRWQEEFGSRVNVFETARGVQRRWRGPRAGAEFVSSLDRNGARRRPVAGRGDLANSRDDDGQIHLCVVGDTSSYSWSLWGTPSTLSIFFCDARGHLNAHGQRNSHLGP